MNPGGATARGWKGSRTLSKSPDPANPMAQPGTYVRLVTSPKTAIHRKQISLNGCCQAKDASI